MAKYYSDLGYSFKETLNAHVRSLGKDPDMIWSAAYDTIRAVYKAKQESHAFYFDHVRECELMYPGFHLPSTSCTSKIDLLSEKSKRP